MVAVEPRGKLFDNAYRTNKCLAVATIQDQGPMLLMIKVPANDSREGWQSPRREAVDKAWCWCWKKPECLQLQLQLQLHQI